MMCVTHMQQFVTESHVGSGREQVLCYAAIIRVRVVCRLNWCIDSTILQPSTPQFAHSFLRVWPLFSQYLHEKNILYVHETICSIYTEENVLCIKVISAISII